eukprot:gnl/TRDRNA2_/TRDRNA2_169147_c2_seq1.p2 gnl/TRDRNA2_/TRDRNA2_169147_c2~~gnl/TRDRNA2_/TRDRNA2_169147_c2_seq1.p2  ORF type:complete len:111 (-),score=9.71 gnl/TRDRNA2_/TRDRNA2_169147_c2_seq1:699-1031(-)
MRQIDIDKHQHICTCSQRAYGPVVTPSYQLNHSEIESAADSSPSFLLGGGGGGGCPSRSSCGHGGSWGDPDSHSSTELYAVLALAGDANGVLAAVDLPVALSEACTGRTC